MPRLLEGRVALVTGAGRGIGRSIALQMAQAGARIVVNDFGVSVAGDSESVSPAESVVGEIIAAGGDAVADAGSVAVTSDANAMVDSAIARFGRLDMVVNNAGIIRMARIDEMSEADWDAVIAVHLQGTRNVSKAAARHFRTQGTGAFVHMTSASGLIGSTTQANYAAAKLGIVGLSKSLALDFSGTRVRSNCVAPSSTSRMTTLTDSSRKGELSAEALARLQQTRAASQPEQMGPLVVYLASDAAAAINGQVIGARGNELYLYGQHRPVRLLAAAAPWTAEALAKAAPTALAPSLQPLERITDVFPWSPL